MSTYNLESHEAFETLKNYGVIQNIVKNVMEQDGITRTNYCFQTFSELLSAGNNALAESLYKAIYRGNGETYRNMPDTTAEEIEAIKNKIKGDIFEIFVMFALQYFQTDCGVGVEQKTYMQITDDEDAGVDFRGIDYATSKKVFGQIKYRNPFATNGNEIAFARDNFTKLYGLSGTQFDFNPAEDYLMLVCNTPINNAMHYRLKNLIGWTGTMTDERHKYVKICDSNYFSSMIGYNNKRFWETLANEFEI